MASWTIPPSQKLTDGFHRMIILSSFALNIAHPGPVFNRYKGVHSGRWDDRGVASKPVGGKAEEV